MDSSNNGNETKLHFMSDSNSLLPSTEKKDSLSTFPKLFQKVLALL